MHSYKDFFKEAGVATQETHELWISKGKEKILNKGNKAREIRADRGLIEGVTTKRTDGLWINKAKEPYKALIKVGQRTP